QTTTVTLSVSAGMEARPAHADSYTLSEDSTLTVTTPGIGRGVGVLANDTDVDGDSLTATLASTAGLQRSVELNASGAFTFTPNANFFGNTRFTYQAFDPSGTPSQTTTVTLSVIAVNDAPTANADSYTLSEDSTLTVTTPGIGRGVGVLVNDTDVDGDSLTATLASTAGLQ